MPLNWDCTRVKDYKTLCWIKEDRPSMHGSEQKRVNPVTEALVFHCMGVSMASITEANADEFYARVAFVEKHQGASVKTLGDTELQDRPITREDVQAHIGLGTNASQEPLGRWLIRNFKHFHGLK